MRSARSNTVTVVPGPIELLGRRQPRRPGADDGDAPAGARLRRLRRDPSLVERAIDDRDLDGLDRDRIVVDAEHARAFARRRAEPAGELREVVGRMQPIDGRLPAVAVHEIVPVGDEVPERTARVAERNAAVHAARRLIAERARSGYGR